MIEYVCHGDRATPPHGSLFQVSHHPKEEIVMKVSKETAIAELKKIVGEDRVITDPEVLKNADVLNRSYAKAFGVYATPPALCVVNAKDTEEVSKVLSYCNDQLISVIPRTGASGGEALLETVNDTTVFLDGSLMNGILKIDEDNMMVTARCGTPLRVIEETVNSKGYTTGHAPQSLPMADIGGLVATRSIGQFSTYYGGIEDLICGMEGVLPNGHIFRIRNVPRRSSGPDLRHILMGSEGGLGFITEVTMKLFPYHPEDRWYGGYKMKNMHEGFKALRAIITAGYKPSVVRLYDKTDMDYNFGSVQMEDEEAFMFFVCEGPAGVVKATGDAIHEIALAHGGNYIGTEAVKHWMIHRNDLCNSYSGDQRYVKFRETQTMYSTTEISASWTDIVKIYDDVIANVPQKCEHLVMLGGHVSHSYINGTNIYFVYRIKMPNPEEADAIHTQVVHAICEEVLKYETGGCVHHHGMGKRRVQMAPKEHGTSYELMKIMKKAYDPNGIMNPGVLVMQEEK